MQTLSDAVNQSQKPTQYPTPSTFLVISKSGAPVESERLMGDVVILVGAEDGEDDVNGTVTDQAF